jgi:hypothetical protein
MNVLVYVFFCTCLRLSVNRDTGRVRGSINVCVARKAQLCVPYM